MKCYSMLRNTRVTAFTVSELFRENQQGEVKLPSLQYWTDGCSQYLYVLVYCLFLNMLISPF